MHGAHLILGKTPNALKKLTDLTNIDLEKSHPDTLIIQKEPDKKNIGIEASRQIIKFLATKPYSGATKTVIIKDAHTLSHQAQNALLKTLEEPPAFAEIYLLAKDEESLLETVVSRCEKIKTISSQKENRAGVSVFMDLTIGQRLDLAEELSKKEKEEVLDYLEQQMEILRKRMLQQRSDAYAMAIEKLLSTSKDIEELNVNIRLALENCFLEIDTLLTTEQTLKSPRWLQTSLEPRYLHEKRPLSRQPERV